VPLLDCQCQAPDRPAGRASRGVRLFIFSLASVACCAIAQTAVETPRTIRVVLDNTYAPYSFRSDDGKLQGILVDQWQAWESKTGIKVEFDATDWGDAIQRVRAGEFDVIDEIVETAERRTYFDFAPPYATVETSIFFRADISGIADLASLRGFPVGVKKGDQHIERLKENGVTTVIPFQNNGEIVEAARQHKINVFVADAPSALYLLHKAGIADEFRQSAPIFHDELRRAVRKGDAATLHTVSAGFAAIESDELKRIDEKWSGSPINKYGWYLKYAGYAAVVATLLIAGLAGWNRTLNKKILQRTAALSESELRFRRLVELMPVAVYVCDASGIIQIYNQRAAELWGREPELGDPAQRYCGSLRLYSADGTLVPHEKSAMAEVLRTGVQVRDLEVLMERPDGSRICVVVNIVPLKNGGEKVTGAINCFEDITQRQQATQAALRLSREIQVLSEQEEDHLRLVIDTIPTMVWSLLPDGTLDFTNQRWMEYTGLSLQEAIENPVAIVHPEDLPRVMEKWLVHKAAAEPVEDEMRLRNAEGEYRWFLVRTVPLRDEQGVIVKWYGTSTDIEDLKRARDQLQTLSRGLVDLQEAERKELSRELHDRIGQNLTALGINLEILRSQSGGDQFGMFRSRLQDSAALVESTADVIENLMSELRPPMLDDYGLLPALDWYAKQFAQRTGIDVTVQGNGPDERASPAAETALFRIAQEALNNVAKHARATRVDIVLDQSVTECTICIVDNGTGFDFTSHSRERPVGGLGMVTMRERTQAVGGYFDIQAVAGRGTRVVVRIPH
jgi:PAS domain S-box-containing protein